MRNFARYAAFIAPLIFSSAVFAEEPDDWMKREFTTPEIAADLAYGLCPLFVSGLLDLKTDHMLAERGFSDEVTVRPSESHGEIAEVAAIRPDGSIHFGGAAGRLCNVTVNGGDSDAVLARLHANMPLMGIDLQPDPANSRTSDTTTLEAFAGPVGDQILHLQLARVETSSPSIIAQLYVTDD